MNPNGEITMDDLLREAIADAKAVRETALENAKIALEEAFTPRLQSMLSKKIQSEMENSDEEEIVIYIILAFYQLFLSWFVHFFKRSLLKC